MVQSLCCYLLTYAQGYRLTHVNVSGQSAICKIF